MPDMLRLSVATAAACTIAQFAAGCGSSSASLPAGVSSRLHTDVAGIRSAAAAHDPKAAHAAVRRFEADVRRFRGADMLASANASMLLSDVSQVNRRVSLEVHAATPAHLPPAGAPPAPSPGAAPSSGPVEPPGPAGHAKGHGKGHDKHGHEGGDGGD
jgi:hypothetical protein